MHCYGTYIFLSALEWEDEIQRHVLIWEEVEAGGRRALVENDEGRSRLDRTLVTKWRFRRYLRAKSES